ncbi:DUF2490 domain-containing protein [Aquimarina muelleri]|uniref:DUF2490 domain-containing protein n=1 Tax=Aquimarina muelleri TaxID=279356 RepID=A0A918N366_9FLAO|nr:DUF2490 domain-containing protein [Aquimarina muelleri]MCX2762532.1 DUF2490 domain-containing protein [Aquimarina muelleri]GGX24402.1 hypothetical protein GCM10007384_27000 [Aquimarina muelleri]
MKIYFSIFLFWVSVLAFGQDETGNWLMYFGTNKINEKFSIHTEIQYRNHTIAPINIDQLLLRTGLNYHFDKNAFATVGYAYISNHLYDSDRKSPEVEEHRIWQQFITTNNLWRLKFEHRYRIEERFIENEFNTRFRYRLMVFLPINKPKIEEGTLFLGVYDEIFINGKEELFDRNRLYGGLGYQFSENLNLQAGILYQRLRNTGKTFLQFGVVFNTDFRKKESYQVN